MKKRFLIVPVVCFLILSVLCGCKKRSYFESRDELSDEEVSTQEASAVQEEAPPDELTKNTSPQEVIVKVYVYNDSDAVVAVEGAQTEDRSGLVDINTAGRDELMGLTGIGATRAEAIIAYRDEHGSFSSAEDSKNVSGIGESIFEKIKDKITV